MGLGFLGAGLGLGGGGAGVSAGRPRAGVFAPWSAFQRRRLPLARVWSRRAFPRVRLFAEDLAVVAAAISRAVMTSPSSRRGFLDRFGGGASCRGRLWLRHAQVAHGGLGHRFEVGAEAGAIDFFLKLLGLLFADRGLGVPGLFFAGGAPGLAACRPRGARIQSPSRKFVRNSRLISRP